MTNLLYIVGGLAGAGIVYSLVSIFISFTLINRFVKMQCSSSFQVRNRRIAREKQDALSDYDTKRDGAKKAQDLEDSQS